MTARSTAFAVRRFPVKKPALPFASRGTVPASMRPPLRWSRVVFLLGPFSAVVRRAAICVRVHRHARAFATPWRAPEGHVSRRRSGGGLALARAISNTLSKRTISRQMAVGAAPRRHLSRTLATCDVRPAGRRGEVAARRRRHRGVAQSSRERRRASGHREWLLRRGFGAPPACD